MTDPMDNSILELLKAADPAPLDEVESSLSEADRTRVLERAVGPGEPLEATRSGRTPQRRFGLVPRIAVVLVLVAAGVAVLLAGGGPAGDSGQAYASTAIAVAEANPRILIGAPGWEVNRADEFEADRGEIEFGDGESRVRLSWSPADSYNDDLPSRLEDGQWYRSHVSCGFTAGTDDCQIFERNDPVTVLGAETFTYEMLTVAAGKEPRSSFETVLPPDGGVYVTIEAGPMSRSEYQEVLDSLYETDVLTWLAALPAKTVKPLERPEIVDEMLAGVPVPDGVDIDALRGEPAALDRYQLGAAVTGAVACGWLDQWATAVESGDDSAAAAATDAMSTSRDWPILQEMSSEGGWAQVIWEYTRDMERGDRHALLQSSGTELGGNVMYELSPAYASGLGCDSEQRTPLDEPPKTARFKLDPVSQAEVDRAIAAAQG